MEQMNKSRDESIAKQRAFYATEKGREYYFRNKRYALNFAQDGSFRVEDVPGGNYRLRVDLREGGESPMRYSAPQIAHLEKEFEVPESPGGRSDEPFDLGKIELQGRKVPTAGKAAPAGLTLVLRIVNSKYATPSNEAEVARNLPRAHHFGHR